VGLLWFLSVSVDASSLFSFFGSSEKKDLESPETSSAKEKTPELNFLPGPNGCDPNDLFLYMIFFVRALAAKLLFSES